MDPYAELKKVDTALYRKTVEVAQGVASNLGLEIKGAAVLEREFIALTIYILGRLPPK